MKLTLPIRFTLVLGAALLLGLLLLLPQQSGEGEAYAEGEVQAVGAKKPSAVQGQQTLESKAMTVLDTYCVSCHGPDQQKGNTRFDAMETIDTVDLQTLFMHAQDAVHFDEMPPAKAKQPTDAEREVLLKWFKEQITGTAAKKLEEKMRRPDSGNYMDHDALFSGEHADKPGFTYDRRWLISEYIFNEKFNWILGHSPTRGINGKRYKVQGSIKGRDLMLTNPFLMSTDAGIRYYANETLNGGHLLTMMTNANDTSDYMLELAERDKNYIPAANEMIAQEIANEETIARRQAFLSRHIERVLRDIYGEKHERLLPDFVPVETPPPLDEIEGSKRQAWHNANPGRGEVVVVFRSIRRLKGRGLSKAEMIDMAEREWFRYGHDERKISTRKRFLVDYWDMFHDRTFDSPRYVEHHPIIEYEPLADEEMRVIAETIRKHREAGDRYLEVIDKCVADWIAGFERERVAAGPPNEEQLDELIHQLVVLIHEREPRDDEAKRYRAVAQKYAAELSRRDRIKNMIQTVMLSSDFVFRSEFGVGEPDEHGRRLLSPFDASYAIAYALTDASPDEELARAAAEGRLNSRADYEREVRRMLAKRDQVYIIDENVDSEGTPNFTKMPIRELRFFREFFGYDKMLGIFKDKKRFGGTYESLKPRVVAEADRLVEYILEMDQDVIEKMLTTDEFYVYHSGNNADMQVASDRVKKIYNYFKDKDWREFTYDDLAKHKDFIAETRMRGIDPNRLDGLAKRYNPLRSFMRQMESFEVRLGKGQKAAAAYPSFPAHGFTGAVTQYGGRMNGPEIARMFNIDLANWDYSTQQPAKIEKRKGILTHPAWLISFAGNFETDPIHRGIWVQEKLLAGTIPDVPITVDAVIPENPHKTLRQRLDDKTNNDYCMRCHVKINPLGIPFEIYDDFGRYRNEERLEYPENLVKKVKDKGHPHEDLRDIYKTLPVDARGYLEGTGNSSLDGEVEDALDLIDRLAKSDRVRQSIIRHAFRYFLGRNETLSDSKTLINADRAYIESGGSFDEVIVSLLTSDSFIYRKQTDTTE